MNAKADETAAFSCFRRGPGMNFGIDMLPEQVTILMRTER